MRKIGIYRRVYTLISETFISEQAEHLQRFEPTFITSQLLDPAAFNSVTLSKNDFFKLKQFSYLLTRSPNLFSNYELLNKLTLIHAHFGVDGVYAMALAEKLKIPFLVTFHGYDITIHREKLWKAGKFLYYQLIFYEEQLKKQAAAFIAVSSFIRNQLIKKGYAPEKIHLHHIGVDTVRFSPTNTKADERYILCVGRHTEKKGIDTLLKAFALIAQKHPNVSLIQVGKGSMTPYLHALAKKLGISDRVRFLGAQKHDIVFKLMQHAEIFVLPSQTASNGDCEGLPIVINEASACGIPVVSTWHSGIPEAVKDGETGFLVPEKDSQSLALQIDLLLSDRALAKSLGLRGREWMCEAFDIRQQTAKLETIYESFQ